MKTQLLILASLIITLNSCSKSGNSTVSESFLEPKVSLSNVWLNLLEDSSINKNVSEMDAYKGEKYRIVESTKHGVVTMNDKGEFTYVPEINFVGSDEFTYEVMINKKMMRNVVKLQVNSINDAPIVLELPVNLEVNEDNVLTGNIWSLDYDSLFLNYMSVAQPAHGSLMILPLGSFIYTPDLNFNGPDTFQVKVSDGTSESSVVTYLINVKSVNDVPVANSLGFAVDAGQTYSGQLIASDVDLNPLTYSIITSPLKGVATINPTTGQLSYSANIGTFGVDVFTYKVNDGTSNSLIKTITANINAVNIPPIVLPFVHTILEDQELMSNLSVSDINGDDTTIEITQIPAHGSLVVNSDLSYVYTPNLNYNGLDSFSYRANDGQLDSLNATVAITVIPVNDAPITEDITLSQLEDTLLLGRLLASDPDGDVLVFSSVSQPSHGVLILNPDGTFVYTPNLNYNGPDSFSYRASDSTLSSVASNVLISINPVNDSPIVNNISFSTPEETVYSGNLSASDVDGNSLSYFLVSAPTKGSVIINSNGSFSYTPNLNENGSDSFTFKVNDGSSEVIAGASVSILPTNDLPTTSNSTISTNEDTVASGSLISNDIDVNTLVYSVVSQGSKGSVTLNSTTGDFLYTPSLNLNGLDSFTFKVNDGIGNSNTSTVFVTITPVNDAPVSSNGALELNEDSVGAGALIASDIDGNSLTYSVVTQPTKGTVTLNPLTGSYIYSPTANSNGFDLFTFKVNDGTIDSNISTVSITVNQQNDLPITSGGSLTFNEDTVGSGSLIASDMDGDPLTYSVVTQPTKGTIVITNTATGSYTFTPTLNANGSDSFSFKVNDGLGNSNSSIVSVTITPVNDAPVSSNGILTLNEDAISGLGTLIASDVDGNSLTYSVVNQGSKGTALVNPSTGSYVYTPNFNANGSDSFTFKANDGTVDSNISTITITITPVNDTPVSNSGTLTLVEDTMGSGTVSASDLDGDSLTYAVVSQGSKGNVTINSITGSYTYTPNLNANGSDSFTFRSNDGTVDSSPATVTVTITPVNDAPVSSNGTLAVNEDSNSDGTLLSGDVDGDTLTYSIVVHPAKGAIVLNSSTGFYTYTPNLNSNGSDSFTFRSNDGIVNSNIATVTVTITPVNDAPLANNGSFSVNEDTVLNSSVLASDLDGDTLTYSVVANPANGSLILNSNGTFTYTPNLNFNGSDSFTFRANDGLLNSNSAIQSITVNSVNDAPVSSNGTLAVTEDTLTNGTLIASDIDGNILTYSVVAQGSKGTVVITNSTTGAYSYTPSLNSTGADSFTFRVNDGTVNSNTATVLVTISSVNDAPLANNSSFTVLEDSGLSARTLSGSDPESSPITYILSSSPTKGVISGFNLSTGSYSYTPNLNANGVDSFTFKTNDGSLDSLTAIVSITITPVNDSPIWTSSTSITLNTLMNSAVGTTLSATDIDGNSITYSMQSCSNGTCSVNSSTGVFSFTPTNSYTGTTVVVAACTDGTVNCSTNTSITINVTSPNSAPLANNGTNKIIVRSGASVVPLSATDAESDPLTYQIMSSPSNGTLSGTGNSRTYTLGSGTICGNEGDTCTNAGTKLIKYGTSTKYIVTKVTGNFVCSNDTFGDPVMGAGKTCSILPLSDSFTFRVNDGFLNSNTATVNINLEDWWNQSWTKRKKLVFNSPIPSSVLDAPVLIKLDSSRIDYSQTQTGGVDLRFVDEAGDLLSYEIESWNPAGISYVWIKTSVGSMEAKTHHVWMYYGNTTATNGQNIADVWSNGYVSVWHFNQTSGTVVDSKGVNNGTAFNLTRTYPGPLGNAYSNTNNNACVEISHNSSQAITGAFTVEALARSTTTTGYSDILQKNIYSGSDWYWAYSLEFNAGKIGTTVTDSSLDSKSYYTSASYYTLNTWKYQAITFNDSANTMRSYSNGVMVEQNTSANRGMYSGSSWNSLNLMGDCANAGYKGQVDEVRLSNIDRSSDWIKFQQLSMSDSLIMYGQEQDVNSPLMGLAYNLRVESGNDDGNILLGSSTWGVNGETGNGVNWLGEENNQDSFGYYRFQLLSDIPSFGVTNAKLKLMGVDVSNTGLWNPSAHYLKVSMQHSGNASQVGAFNQYPGGAGGVTDSSTKINWNSSSLNWNGSGWNESPNLSSVVNQVRSSFSLPKSNYIQLWIKRGANFNCGSSSFCQAGSADSSYQSGLLSPQLLIEY